MKAPIFTKEHLIFIVSVVLRAAKDRVENEPRIAGNCGPYIDGAIQTAGMALAILSAQVTGDGMAITDALALTGDFVARLESRKPIGDKDIETYARQFVTTAF